MQEIQNLDEENIAAMPKRILAFLIDELAVSILLLIIFYDPIMAIVASFPSELTADSQLLLQQNIIAFSQDNLFLIIALKVSYHTFLIWQNKGMTLGKYLLKIRVISLFDHGAPTFSYALVRAVLRLLNDLFFYLGFIMAFFLPLKQTFHDKIAKCVVVDV